MINRVYRVVKKVLRGPARNRGPVTSADLSEVNERAFWLVTAFYLAFIPIAFRCARNIYADRFMESSSTLLWPVFWVDFTGFEIAASLTAFLLCASTILAVFFPIRATRALLFLSFLTFSALDNSFGSINHSMHYIIWLSGILIFAPTRNHKQVPKTFSRRASYAFPVFFAQFAIAFFYSLSGYWKTLSGFDPVSTAVSSFHPDALPLLVMGRWMQTGNEPLFAEFFASNLWVAWPSYLLVIYFELFFIVALFRPQVHRLFGVAMGVFHLGVWAVMGISFAYQSMVVVGLFVLSPFAVLDRSSLSEKALQLPLLGDIAAIVIHFIKRPASASKRS
jgi:hypothetical protein